MHAYVYTKGEGRGDLRCPRSRSSKNSGSLKEVANADGGGIPKISQTSFMVGPSYKKTSTIPGIHGDLLQEELPLRGRVHRSERVLREVGRDGVLHQPQVEKVHAAEVQEDMQGLLI